VTKKYQIAISACLFGQQVRYDAKQLPALDQHVILKALRLESRCVEFIPFCPETGIGLGVPRAKIQLVRNKNKKICVLGVEDHTWDVTKQLKSYAVDFLQHHPDIKHYVVKSKSPSCGYQSTPLFEKIEQSEQFEPVSDSIVKQTDLTSGIFVQTVLEFESNVIIIDET